MGTMQDELMKKGLAKPRGSNPQYRGGKKPSPEEEYQQKITQYFGDEYIDSILSGGEKNYNKYIDDLKNYIKKNKDGITTSQLRNIYSELKPITDPKELWKLRPKLAYVAGRSDKKGMKELAWLLDELIKNIGKDEEKKLENFKDFFEAVIAYHKYFGGK